jgi:VRR-NUC domain
MASEQDLIKKVQYFFTERGDRIFRQNTGFGWVGAKFFKPPMETSVRLSPQDVVIKNARPLHAGLCKGSSDMIGWTRKIITPDMVGQTVAIFTAIECKTIGHKATEDQIRFIEAVNKAGGIGKIAYSTDDLG